MSASSMPVKCPTDRYWRGRWLETERALAASSNDNLRAVYTELLGHYQRMADRHESRQILAKTPSHKLNGKTAPW